MDIGISEVILTRLTNSLKFDGTSVLGIQGRSRERLGISMLRQLGDESPVESKPNLSDKRLEMELLLLNLGSAGKDLLAALAVEAQRGDCLFNLEPERLSALDQWVEASQAVRNAQIAYDRAADDYRSFVASLAPPLRAVAAARATALWLSDTRCRAPRSQAQDSLTWPASLDA